MKNRKKKRRIDMREVVIVSAARTAIASFMGALHTVPAPKLGAEAIRGALQKAELAPEYVDEVIMGNVLTAAVGQAPARQAALAAGLGNQVPCMTINKVCGSGLKAVMLAAQAIMVGDADVVIAGGQENMSLTPYLLAKARSGLKMGHAQLEDSLIRDGLWDVYNDYHMGSAAELCASDYGFSREDQDEFALTSYKRAQAAIAAGKFAGEIIPVHVPQKRGEPIAITADEEPFRVKFDKVATLRPAFKKDGTVTAANASSINDGAAALVVMAAEKAKELGLKPLARIIAQASAAKKPEYFTTAPADAIAAVLQKAKMEVSDIDLFEVNEAFSVVSLAVNKLAGLDPEKVNIYGGAVALGHPIGASGARILTTLLSALHQENKKTGLATLCIGGGEASALIVEKY
jgi:acetyl-CoA C-acetyltransferase